MIGQYEILTAFSIVELNKKVSDYINVGWILQGGVSVSVTGVGNDKGVLYAQAVLFWGNQRAAPKPGID